MLVKLEKEHFIRPLSDILTTSSDQVTDIASSSVLISQMNFSSLTELKNSFMDIFDQEDGLLIFVLQPTGSFSRKKSSNRPPSGSFSAVPGISSPSLTIGTYSSPIILGTSGELTMSINQFARPYKSSSAATGLSESVAQDRMTRMESQTSQTLVSTDMVIIDFKNDEIEFHEELGRGASGAVVYACSIKGTL